MGLLIYRALQHTKMAFLISSDSSEHHIRLKNIDITKKLRTYVTHSIPWTEPKNELVSHEYLNVLKQMCFK